MIVIWNGPPSSLLAQLREPGLTYDLEDAVAQEMIQRGLAVAVVEEPEELAAIASKPADNEQDEE